MEELFGLVIWIFVLWAFGKVAKSKVKSIGGTSQAGKNTAQASVRMPQQGAKSAQERKYQESSAMPHSRRASGSYDTFNRKSAKNDSGAMPHNHRESGTYDTFNRKSIFNTSGSMPHVHSEGHYTSMADASKLPPGYILLNGEPVRVADLEGK